MPDLSESLPREFVSGTVLYDFKTPVTEALDKIRKFGAVVITRDREYYGIVDTRSIFRTRGLKSLSFSKKFSVGKFSRKLPVLDSNTSIGRLVNYFHEFSAKALPYREGNRITGVVKREVALSTILSLHMLSKAKVGELMTSPVVTIGTESNVSQAMEAMEENKLSRLVVVDNGRAAGMLSLRDITERFSKPQERLPEKKSYSFSPANVPVRSVMKAPVHSIDFSRPVEDAARKLLENRISSLVVTKGSYPAGIISIRDIIEGAAASTAKTESSVMISGLDEYTKESEDSVRGAAKKLLSKINKFEKLDADYISVNIKRHKERNYEMHARLALRKRGIVFASAEGYSLESTLATLFNSIYKRVSGRKESFVDRKRSAERHYGE